MNLSELTLKDTEVQISHILSVGSNELRSTDKSGNLDSTLMGEVSEFIDVSLFLAAVLR